MEHRFNTKWHYKAGAVIGEAYCFSQGEMLIASRRIIRHSFLQAQGELLNSAFHETRRSAGSAFIGVSSFNMRIWF
jgi:hypothetical protein